MYRLVSVAFLFLAACAQSGGTPESVMVQKDRITVRMSSGWPCVGFRTPATETPDGWAGRLEGCPEQYPYRVTLKKGNNPVRLVLVEVFTAIGLGDSIAPVAEVEITTGKGRTRVFRSPEPTRARGSNS